MSLFFEQKLESARQSNSYRKLTVDRPPVDFTSNDYLGLSKNRRLFEKTGEILRKYYPNGQNGSGASRLLNGNSLLFEDTETRIARFHKAPGALLFSSGYAANVGLLSILAGRKDSIFYDELVHASLRDGIRMSFAPSFSFRHNDLSNLEKKLKNKKGDAYIVVESLYSMDGDFADLSGLLDICQKHDAYLIVDEAHAGGIYENGAGLASCFNENPNLLARVITHGKAFGVHGASVCSSLPLKEYLINFSRPFIYSTAMSPHSVAAVNASYSVMENNAEERERLFFNIRLYRENSVRSNDSQIQYEIFPGASLVKRAAKLLREDGFDVRPILPPTVPKGKERLRICLHSYNLPKDILQLLSGISNIRA